MTWKKVLGIIWAIISIPAVLFAIVGSGFCTAPIASECSSGLQWIWILPVIFIVGAVAGFRAKPTDSWLTTFIVLLPIVSLVFFVGFPFFLSYFSAGVTAPIGITR